MHSDTSFGPDQPDYTPGVVSSLCPLLLGFRAFLFELNIRNFFPSIPFYVETSITDSAKILVRLTFLTSSAFNFFPSDSSMQPYFERQL
jgi:hypothetical protein